MAYTNTNSAAQFTADTVMDIYRIIGVDNELAPHFRTEVELTKPRVLPNISTTQLLQDPVKNPRLASDTSGTITKDVKLLAVNEAMVYTDIDVDSMRQDFPEFHPTGNLIDLRGNAETMSAIMDVVRNSVGGQVADNIIQGDTTLGAADPLRFTDGLLKKIDADADVVDTLNQGLITTTNILDIIEAVSQDIPVQIRNRANVKFFMSYGTLDIANEANRLTQQNSTLMQVGEITRVFNKYPIVPLASMPANRIIVAVGDTTVNSNLVQGFWFQNDVENFLLFKEAMADKDWLLALRFLLGVQYRTGLEIVNYLGV